MAKTLIERADLYFTDGKSDKVYHCQLFEVDGGFTVEFQYGRRGSALQAGTKTANPVDEASARKTFDKLVKEKTGKGYTPDISGEIFVGTEHADRDTGLRPQLLNPITEAEFNGILAGTQAAQVAWGAQEKFDGENRMTRAMGAGVIGSNRKGLSVPIPQTIADALAGYNLVLCGEDMGGGRYVVWDLLELNGEDLRGLKYRDRLAKLIELDLPPMIEKLRTVFGSDMRALADEVRKRRGEGVVFKDMDAPFTPDRPASGGPALKFKFMETATARVSRAHPTKRSVSLEMLDGEGKWVGVGNVTVPADQDIPQAGDLVEVRYLYAYKGGSLYQPVLLGKRTDLEPSAATMAQLKFKAGAAEDEAEEDQQLAA